MDVAIQIHVPNSDLSTGQIGVIALVPIDALLTCLGLGLVVVRWRSSARFALRPDHPSMIAEMLPVKDYFSGVEDNLTRNYCRVNAPLMFGILLMTNHLQIPESAVSFSFGQLAASILRGNGKS
jgi:hypothetical protein